MKELSYEALSHVSGGVGLTSFYRSVISAQHKPYTHFRFGATVRASSRSTIGGYAITTNGSHNSRDWNWSRDTFIY